MPNGKRSWRASRLALRNPPAPDQEHHCLVLLAAGGAKTFFTA
jgi:hypothetical protein